MSIDRLTQTAELYKEFRNEAVWPDARIAEELTTITRTESQTCFMKSEGCSQVTFSLGRAYFTILEGRMVFGCLNHIEPFAVMEGLVADKLYNYRSALLEEKKRREERDEQIVRREQNFHNFLQRAIAARDQVELELVTDDHIKARLSNMTPQQITRIHEILDRQEEERRRGNGNTVKNPNSHRQGRQRPSIAVAVDGGRKVVHADAGFAARPRIAAGAR